MKIRHNNNLNYVLSFFGIENSLQYHKERSVSGEKVDLQSNVVVVKEPPSRLLLIPVSYTHLTLPTICSV